MVNAFVVESTGAPCILLVDDDAMMRGVVRRMLAPLGIEVCEAASVAEARRLALASTRPIALLLTDVVMPIESGVILAAALRAATGPVRVLFMSGYDRNAVRKHGVLDSDDFVQKPFTPDVLRERVASALVRPT